MKKKSGYQWDLSNKLITIADNKTSAIGQDQMIQDASSFMGDCSANGKETKWQI